MLLAGDILFTDGSDISFSSDGSLELELAAVRHRVFASFDPSAKVGQLVDKEQSMWVSTEP